MVTTLVFLNQWSSIVLPVLVASFLGLTGLAMGVTWVVKAAFRAIRSS